MQPQVSHTSSPTTLFMIHHHFHMLTVLMFTVTEIVISAQLVAEYTTIGVHTCCHWGVTIDAKHMMPLLMYSLLVIRSNGGAIKAFYKKCVWLFAPVAFNYFLTKNHDNTFSYHDKVSFNRFISFSCAIQVCSIGLGGIFVSTGRIRSVESH